MSSRKRIVIGTRGSALAVKQVDIVANAIQAADPSFDIEVRIIQTQGDVDQGPIPLDTVGKGWFTGEIERALLNREIDLAAHSLKDMADDMPAGLYTGAYLPREDARDVLVTKYGGPLEELPPGAVIGSDSSRRQVQMRALRPDVVMKSIRGNVPTRLQKLMLEPYDAVILAGAGLKRLGLAHRIVRYFEPREMTPAPGQGIIAIQAREDDMRLQRLLGMVNDADAARAARVERSFSKAMGGGCKSPTGAYAFRDGGDCVLIGMRAGSGPDIRRDEMRAPWTASGQLGEALARKLLEN
ncbi:MAG TPA: hydroxymethylbilane synthase [Candidatus Paceibacterota bacterium]|nr:hydroxymethylbilane synthase [Candidatus Paceibacterota bacterium]